jgi:hypothetical protein
MVDNHKIIPFFENVVALFSVCFNNLMLLLF